MNNVFVGIQYDEESQDSYEGVELSWGKKEKKLFNTGDPVADWKSMLEFVANPKRFSMVLYSSSVDHFLMDGDGYHMATVEGVDILRKGQGDYLRFTCPSCNGHNLDEVMVNVIQESRISTILYDKEHGLVCDYAHNAVSHHEGEISHWQCGACGCILKTEEDVSENLEKL